MNTVDLDNEQTNNPTPPQELIQNEIDSSAPAEDVAELAISASSSILLEFPGANRAGRPAWRNALSERVREIQQKRAQTAALEAEEAARRLAEEQSNVESFEEDLDAPTKVEQRAKQLGLVPPPAEIAEMNPLVVAALRRIERARTAPPVPRTRAARATKTGAAVAHAQQERYEPLAEQAPAPKESRPESVGASRRPSERAAKINDDHVTNVAKADAKGNTGRLPNLVPVPPRQAPVAIVMDSAVFENASPATVAAPDSPKTVTIARVQVAEAVESAEPKAQARRVTGVIDDHWLERNGTDALPKVASPKETYDDRASLGLRFTAAVVDLLVIVFLAAPFAAIIELTFGNWGDPRVQVAMGGIFVVVMFLYLTCSTALAGRTWGMSLFSLLTVHSDTALAPTTGQCARRAIVYMFSIGTLGLGLLFALFDSEGRTAHDRLSRTTVVRE